MATLLAKVRHITKSTMNETPDVDIVGFLQNAIEFIIASVPKESLWFLASDGANITDASGQAVAQDTILSVKRNNVPCLPVSFELSYQLGLSGSLYEASAYFPKFYLESGKVYIKPNPSSSAIGVISRIVIPTITSSTDETTYSNIQNIIVSYASFLDFKGLSGYYSVLANSELSDIISDVSTALTNFSSALPTWSAQTMTALTLTNITDALLKAQNLIDGTEITDNAQEFIDNHDSEMTAVTIQTASQEINRAKAELEKEMQYQNEYSLDIQNEMNRNSSAIQVASTYLNEASVRIQSIQTVNGYIAKSKSYDEQSIQMFSVAKDTIIQYVNKNKIPAQVKQENK